MVCEAAFRSPICAANTASATPAPTNGKRSLAGWRSRQAAEDAGGREHRAEAIRYQTTEIADLRQRVKAIAQKRRRFALPALPGGEACGAPRGGRKCATRPGAPMLVPMEPNDRWLLDFVSDQL